MNLFNKTVEGIKKRRQNVLNGGVNAIPFPLPALTRYVPGIMKGTQYGITGDSGASKSKLLRYMFVQTPFDFYYKNKDEMNIDVEIFLFSLEDNAEVVMKNLIVSALAKRKGIRLSTLTLDSYFENDKLPDNVLHEIDSLEDYFILLLSKVHIIDNIRNPTGILKAVKTQLLKPHNGNYVDEHGEIVPVDSITHENYKNRQLSYQTVNENKFNIVLTDNLQNVNPEQSHGGNKWAAYDQFCRDYMRGKLCNFFQTCNCIVQQQEKSSGKAQFTNTGNQVVEKLLPSVAGLSEYKNSVDSAHCLFGIFNPYKHKVEHFQTAQNNWYDISQLGDHYRNLSILKSNFAETVNTSLFFDAFAESFSELPNGADAPAMALVYEHIQTLKDKNFKSKLLF